MPPPALPPTAPPAPSLFGKLPASGDFVRRNAAGADVDELDGWLQEGLHHGRTWVPGWAARFAAGPTCAFLFHTRAPGHYAVGAMAPSRDRSGRQFPFLVFLRVDLGGGPGPASWPLVPLRYGPFLRGAAALARDAAALPLADVADRAAALPAPLSDGDADARYRDFVRGERGPDEALNEGAGRSAFAVEGVRHVQALGANDVASSNGFVFALDDAPDAMAALWVDWLLQTLHVPGLRPFALWPYPAPDEAARLHLFVRRPAPQALARVLAGESPGSVFASPPRPRPGEPAAGLFGDLLRPPPARPAG